MERKRKLKLNKSKFKGDKSDIIGKMEKPLNKRKELLLKEREMRCLHHQRRRKRMKNFRMIKVKVMKMFL